jgi:xanthine/CO dehydrogenase XdhC/CoxF family maturation factor
MIANSAALPEFFAHYRNRGEPLVLATIIETIGSTYRKAGAQMLIANDGQAAGLLSGGCAESDLIERAQRVFSTGNAEIATFDTRGSDDVIWGIGLGCEGAMRILLSRIDASNGYQPFSYTVECKEQHRRGAFAIVVEGALGVGKNWRVDSTDAPPELRARMSTIAQGNAAQTVDIESAKIFIAPIDLPARLLVLGAGADAVPVVELAALLGWQVTIADHRSAYTVAERFARAKQVVLSPAKELSQRLVFDDFDAAVVMSHHLLTDQIYLAALAESTVRYVGLLGPANRRKRLLAEIGERADKLANRLAGPVGLDIGARTPEAIALAIVAEIHTHLEGRTGSSFSGLLRSA